MMELKWIEGTGLDGNPYRLLKIGPLIDVRIEEVGEERCCDITVGAQPEAVRGVEYRHYCWGDPGLKEEHEILRWLRAHLLECTDALDLLMSQQSLQALRSVRLWERATEVFGNRNDADDWLDEPLLAIGNRTPREATQSEQDMELVLQVLGRMECGIYS
jgi:hypothetical protein